MTVVFHMTEILGWESTALERTAEARKESFLWFKNMKTFTGSLRVRVTVVVRVLVSFVVRVTVKVMVMIPARVRARVRVRVACG